MTKPAFDKLRLALALTWIKIVGKNTEPVAEVTAVALYGHLKKANMLSEIECLIAKTK